MQAVARTAAIPVGLARPIPGEQARSLQYRGIGRWSDHLYAERIYMLLSLFAKSLLAWQVFAGKMRP